jgi:phage terminase small subunit
LTKLTPKQQLFCDFYLESLNATQSAKKAGYSEKSAEAIGLENLGKPRIKEYIDERMSKLNNDVIASANEVLEKLTEIIRNPKSKNFEVIKCCELLGKRYRLWNEDVQTNPPIINIINDIPQKK